MTATGGWTFIINDTAMGKPLPASLVRTRVLRPLLSTGDAHHRHNE
jgi:hypothetical protein